MDADEPTATAADDEPTATAADDEPTATAEDLDIHPQSLEEIREEHGLGDEWEPRFTADTPVAERKADEYEELGYEARVFPHPEDVSRGQMPGRGDRCVVYTRERSDDEQGGGLDDDLF